MDLTLLMIVQIQKFNRHYKQVNVLQHQPNFGNAKHKSWLLDQRIRKIHTKYAAERTHDACVFTTNQ